MKGHTQDVLSLLLLSTNNIASASEDKNIKIWNWKDGNCLKTLTGHTELVWGIIELPNKLLVSGSGDKTLKIWDTQCIESSASKTIDNGSYCYCLLLLGGDMIASVSDSIINVFDLFNWEAKPKQMVGHTEKIWDIKLNPDGNKLFSASEDKSLKIWNWKSLECLETV